MGVAHCARDAHATLLMLLLLQTLMVWCCR